MSDQVRNVSGVVHAPHSVLTDYYADEGQRPGWVRRVFDGSAADYDRIERIAGLGSGLRYRGQALLRAGLKPGMSVLDVGVGTGLVSREAARIVGASGLVTGIDPSSGMLRNAQVPGGVRLVGGAVEQLPFADASFDFVIMGYALRHITDLLLAFRECHRVLRPGGRICILEITLPQNKLRATLLKAYMRGVVPMLARLTARNVQTPMLWSYYWDTIAACAPPEQVIATLEASGFAKVDRDLELGIFSEYRSDKTPV